jgi:hypothetical protein
MGKICLGIFIGVFCVMLGWPGIFIIMAIGIGRKLYFMEPAGKPHKNWNRAHPDLDPDETIKPGMSRKRDKTGMRYKDINKEDTEV